MVVITERLMGETSHRDGPDIQTGRPLFPDHGPDFSKKPRSLRRSLSNLITLGATGVIGIKDAQAPQIVHPHQERTPVVQKTGVSVYENTKNYKQPTPTKPRVDQSSTSGKPTKIHNETRAGQPPIISPASSRGEKHLGKGEKVVHYYGEGSWKHEESKEKPRVSVRQTNSQLEKMLDVIDLLGGHIDDTNFFVKPGTRPEDIEQQVRASIDVVAQKLTQLFENKLSQLNPQDLKQLSQLEGSALNKIGLGGVLENLSKAQIKQIKTAVSKISEDSTTSDINIQSFIEDHLPKDAKGWVDIGAALATLVGVYAVIRRIKSPQLRNTITNSIVIMDLLVACAGLPSQLPDASVQVKSEVSVDSGPSDLKRTFIHQEPLAGDFSTLKNNTDAPNAARLFEQIVKFYREHNYSLQGVYGEYARTIQPSISSVEFGGSELVAVETNIHANYGEGDGILDYVSFTGPDGNPVSTRNALWRTVAIGDGYRTTLRVVEAKVDAQGQPILKDGKLIYVEGMLLLQIDTTSGGTNIIVGDPNNPPKGLLLKGDPIVSPEQRQAMVASWAKASGFIMNDFKIQGIEPTPSPVINTPVPTATLAPTIVPSPTATIAPTATEDLLSTVQVPSEINAQFPDGQMTLDENGIPIIYGDTQYAEYVNGKWEVKDKEREQVMVGGSAEYFPKSEIIKSVPAEVWQPLSSETITRLHNPDGSNLEFGLWKTENDPKIELTGKTKYYYSGVYRGLFLVKMVKSYKGNALVDVPEYAQVVEIPLIRRQSKKNLSIYLVQNLTDGESTQLEGDGLGKILNHDPTHVEPSAVAQVNPHQFVRMLLNQKMIGQQIIFSYYNGYIPTYYTPEQLAAADLEVEKIYNAVTNKSAVGISDMNLEWMVFSQFWVSSELFDNRP